MVAASQKLLSLVGVANLATRAASSRPYRCGGNWGRKRAVRQTMTLPTLYRYIGSLTRPIRYMVKTRGRKGCVNTQRRYQPCKVVIQTRTVRHKLIVHVA